MKMEMFGLMRLLCFSVISPFSFSCSDGVRHLMKSRLMEVMKGSFLS